MSKLLLKKPYPQVRWGQRLLEKVVSMSSQERGSDVGTLRTACTQRGLCSPGSPSSSHTLEPGAHEAGRMPWTPGYVRFQRPNAKRMDAWDVPSHGNDVRTGTHAGPQALLTASPGRQHRCGSCSRLYLPRHFLPCHILGRLLAPVTSSLMRK